MRGARRFFSREKQVFLVGFSLTILRFPRKSKNRLNTSLDSSITSFLAVSPYAISQTALNCSKLAIKTLEQGVKYAHQS